jgi:hypothetical protein
MPSTRAERPLWACPACGRTFANRNQSHACGRHTLDAHFAGKSEEVRRIYDAFLELLERCGPVTVLPEKTRIAFHVRMSFAQLTVRRDRVLGHFVLAREVPDPAISRIEFFSRRNIVHHFRLERSDQVERLGAFAREAYEVGCPRDLADHAGARGRAS